MDGQATSKLADRWSEHSFPLPAWDYRGLPAWRGPAWLDFCVTAVSVVGCLWPPEGLDAWAVRFDGEWLSDAPGLFACFTKALQPAPDGLDLDRFRHWSDKEAGGFFAGRGVLQLLSERRARLTEVTEALDQRWDGHAVHLAEESGGEARRVVELLGATIAGYRDRANTVRGLVRFDKLAHLATAMMAARSPMVLRGLEQFPVYPDYVLPRVLRHHGVLVYEKELADAIKKRRLLDYGGRWEVAIRWATVYAAEELRRHLNGRGNPVVAPALDFALWRSGVLDPEAATMGEHHRALTLSY